MKNFPRRRHAPDGLEAFNDIGGRDGEAGKGDPGRRQSAEKGAHDDGGGCFSLPERLLGGDGNERRLYFRSLNRLEARPIPGTEGATTAFFSPDGEWVGFYGNFYNEVKLKKVALDSGLPITLTDVHDARGASWGPGDEIIFSDGSGLSRVSASGGSPSVVTSPDPKQGETWHRWPEILPGGRAILYTAWGGSITRARIDAFAPGSRERTTLVEGATKGRVSDIGLEREGGRYYYEAELAGAQDREVRVDLRTGAISPVIDD